MIKYLFSKTWVLYFTGALVEPAGLCFGFFIALLMGMELSAAKTISLETGIQNVGLAVAMIELNFDGDQKTQVLEYPLICALWYLFWSVFATGIYRWVLIDDEEEERLKQIISDDLEDGKITKPRIKRTPMWRLNMKSMRKLIVTAIT
eukprot:UN04058